MGASAPLNVASAGLTRPPEGSLMAPLEFLAPSSPFGYRVSPITGAAGDFHLGQDFAAGCGTRVYSADAGVVRAAGWHPWGGGNRVEIDHGNGLITTYNHLEAVAVRTGDSVQVGQVIARVGTTGWSTGCHLHFETILHGKHTSPLNWTFLPTRQLDKLEDIAMVSYDGKAADNAGAQRWAIPVAADNSHTVLGGEEELSEAPAETPSSDATATASPSPTGSAPGTSASPTPTGTSSDTTTAPTGTTAAPTTTAPAPTGTTAAPTTTAPAPTGTTAAPTTTAPAPTGTTAAPTTTAPAPTGTTAAPTTTAPALTTPPAKETATTSTEPSAPTVSPSPSAAATTTATLTATTTATPTYTATGSETAGR
ncbi:peptidoglycan DD-metalloendopeptidase family protein [Pseudarthrobacter psychrotolerans]|uniref:Peptidoglycan DD-metalloendopeptidase family protein n=1 Tax=Pseudarthrobacter psychrotolerans TaxID=2697569 RepID=A0A6P1NRL9_9MICC|nr:peptidoglycan DD-metalloendopeptidase family protein [Pseudarthrobacter psychrotolerans]